MGFEGASTGPSGLAHSGHTLPTLAGSNGLTRAPPMRQSSSRTRVHPLAWLVLAGVFVPWVIGGWTVAGFNVTGWAWVVPTAFAAVVVTAKADRLSFPISIWLPWLGVLVLNGLLRGDDPAALQSLVQMVAPLVVGCAASTLRWEEVQFEALLRTLDRCVFVILALLILRLPGLLSGHLVGHGYMAAEAIAVLLFGAVYAVRYSLGSRVHLVYYGAVCMMPLVVMTRGAMAAIGLSLVLAPGPLRITRRVAFAGIMLLAGLLMLSTERVRQRTFYSGKGTWQDISLSNPDFATSGRVPMWETLWDQVDESPLLGHGLNASRSRMGWAGFELYLPHNDWLKVLYDFGLVGVTALALAMLATGIGLVRRARRMATNGRILAYAAAAGFIPFALIMLTDNPVLYVQFYGNLHFLLLGAAFAGCSARHGCGQSFAASCGEKGVYAFRAAVKVPGAW